MTDSWARVLLGDVARLDVEKVPLVPGHQYPIAGVLNAGQGMLRREPIDSSQTNYAALHRLHTDQLVMRKLTAWEGPITIVPADFDGYFVSTEFPTFTLDSERVLPSFMRLLCMQPDLWERMKGASTGTVQRRKRVNPTQLLAIDVSLPPLTQQRRIVDLVEAARSTERVAYQLHEDLAAAWEILLANYEQAETGRAPLSALVQRIDAGKSPRAWDRPPTEDERGVLKVSAVGRNEFRPAEAKALPDDVLLPESTLVAAGDVLVTRASGALDRVGQACRVGDSPGNLYISDKTLRLVPNDLVDPDWLTFALLAPAARSQIEALTTGSDMRNISQRALLQVEVAMPNLIDQVTQATAIRAVVDASGVAAAYAGRVAELRTALLSDLLAGAHHISDSYDELLELAS